MTDEYIDHRIPGNVLDPKDNLWAREKPSADSVALGFVIMLVAILLVILIALSVVNTYGIDVRNIIQTIGG